MTTPANGTVQAWIDRLDLSPHPEGGYYREAYASSTLVPVPYASESHHSTRRASTSIYFLLQNGQCSRLHRISADETWHHYAGDPLTVVVLPVGGAHPQLIHLGIPRNLGDPADPHAPQAVVQAGHWFGALHTPADLAGGHGYSLVGCTVAPGFDMQDLVMGEREALLLAYPTASDLILRLT
jgi:uncharacterized protein